MKPLQSTFPITQRSSAAPLVISVDIGQVLLDRGQPGEIAATRIPDLPPIQGAVEGFRKIVLAFGRENVWIVSRCSQASESSLAVWLVAHSLVGPEPNAIPGEHVVFCRERADKAKILLEIGASAHIDDRADVLGPTRGVGSLRRRILFCPKLEDRHSAELTGLPGLILWDEGWAGLPEMLVHELAMADAP